MKKTILAAFIVLLVSKPCFAQQIEPEVISSLNGTVWQESLRIPIIPGDYYPSYHLKRYFYDGRVYIEGGAYLGPYVDLLAFSFSFHSLGLAYNEIGIWLPAVGVGMNIQGGLFHAILPFLSILIYNKIEDNWIPEETISIYPTIGAQGTTLTVEIHGSYTTFKENPPVEIIFDPPDGLSVSNIDLANVQWIFFDLDIAINAPVGFRDVIVIWDDGEKSVTGNDAFVVLQKN